MTATFEDMMERLDRERAEHKKNYKPVGSIDIKAGDLFVVEAFRFMDRSYTGRIFKRVAQDPVHVWGEVVYGRDGGEMKGFDKYYYHIFRVEEDILSCLTKAKGDKDGNMG